MQLAKGAEAELTREGGAVVKVRIKKGYRLPELDDKLRKRRTSAEARLLREARRAGVLTPQIIEEGKTTIKMEFMDGNKVKDEIDKKNKKKQKQKTNTKTKKKKTKPKKKKKKKKKKKRKCRVVFFGGKKKTR